MLMQFGLLYLWKAIETDWCGFARFRHGDKNPGTFECIGYCIFAYQRLSLLKNENSCF